MIYYKEIMITGVYIGSGVFAALGVIACIVANVVVSNKSKDRVSKSENRTLATIAVTMATFCMWLQWVSTLYLFIVFLKLNK